jgi:hypothetical protein
VIALSWRRQPCSRGCQSGAWCTDYTQRKDALPLATIPFGLHQGNPSCLYYPFFSYLNMALIAPQLVGLVLVG